MLRHFKCNLQHIAIHSVVSGRKLQYAVCYVSILKTKSDNVIEKTATMYGSILIIRTS